jgi:hypothetical protein
MQEDKEKKKSSRLDKEKKENKKEIIFQICSKQMEVLLDRWIDDVQWMMCPN